MGRFTRLLVVARTRSASRTRRPTTPASRTWWIADPLKPDAEAGRAVLPAAGQEERRGAIRRRCRWAAARRCGWSWDGRRYEYLGRVRLGKRRPLADPAIAGSAEVVLTDSRTQRPVTCLAGSGVDPAGALNAWHNVPPEPIPVDGRRKVRRPEFPITTRRPGSLAWTRGFRTYVAPYESVSRKRSSALSLYAVDDLLGVDETRQEPSSPATMAP